MVVVGTRGAGDSRVGVVVDAAAALLNLLKSLEIDTKLCKPQCYECVTNICPPLIRYSISHVPLSCNELQRGEMVTAGSDTVKKG